MRTEPSRFRSTTVGGQLFLLDEREGASYRIGGVGGRAWELLASGSSIDDVASSIATTQRVDRARVLADIENFVDRLVAAGLVTVGGNRNSGPDEQPSVAESG